MSQDEVFLHKLVLHRDKWLLLLLVIAALGLRLYKLGQESLWLDEIGQVLIARNPWWLTILRSAQHYGNTPLDYLVTHFVLHVGESEHILRLPAVIWGTLSVVVAYWLGRDMFDKPTGYLAAFLLTITPAHVFYSREVRFYSLATFLALLSVYAFKRAVDKSNRWTWVLYGLVHVLALHAHYNVLVTIGVQGIWLLWATYTGRRARSTFVAFALTVGIVCVLFLPWVCYDMYYEQVHKEGVLHTGFQFELPSSTTLLEGFFLMTAVPFSIAEPSAFWVGFAWAAVIGGVVVALRARSGSAAMTILLVLLLVGGVSSVLVLDWLTSYFFRPRQFLIYTPLLLLTISAGYLNVFRLAYSRLTRKSRTGMADGSAIVLVMLFSLAALWQPLADVYGRHKEDWRGTARYLARHLASNDVLLTITPSHLGFYAPELSVRTERLNNVPSLLQAAQSNSRVWILGTHARLRKHSPDIYQWIQEERPIEVSLDPKLRVYVYSEGIPPAQLLEELVRSGAYGPSTLLYSDFLEKTIGQGYVQDSINMVLQVLDDEELGIAEKANIAVRAGRALSDHGEEGKATDMLARATSIDPANSDAWVALGIVYSRQGRVKDGISAYHKALESDPNNYWANHLLAGALYRRGQWEDVVSLEHRAVESAPRDDLRVASLTRIARAYSQLGNTTRACQVLRQAYAIQESQEVLDEITTLGCTDGP